jgi:hypothetical protein
MFLAAGKDAGIDNLSRLRFMPAIFRLSAAPLIARNFSLCGLFLRDNRDPACARL